MLKKNTPKSQEMRNEKGTGRTMKGSRVVGRQKKKTRAEATCKGKRNPVIILDIYLGNLT